jgi:hypothetical protein
MSGLMLITVYLCSALVGGLTAAIVAPYRGRHPGFWVIFGFLIPPLVIVLLILPAGRGRYYHDRDPFLDRDDIDDLL